jgi:hypothetical protein
MDTDDTGFNNDIGHEDFPDSPTTTTTTTTSSKEGSKTTDQSRHTEAAKNARIAPFMSSISKSKIEALSLPPPNQKCVVCFKSNPDAAVPSLAAIRCFDCADDIYLCNACDLILHNKFPNHTSRQLLPSHKTRKEFAEFFSGDVGSKTPSEIADAISLIAPLNLAALEEGFEYDGYHLVKPCFRAAPFNRACGSVKCCGTFSGYTASPFTTEPSLSTIKYVFSNGVVFLNRACYICNHCGLEYAQDPKFMIAQSIYPIGFTPVNSTKGTVLISDGCLKMRSSLLQTNAGIAEGTYATAMSSLNPKALSKATSHRSQDVEASV